MLGYTFTERVRHTLARARHEAANLGHPYVGCEHVLLGLLITIDGVAAAALKKFQIDPSMVEREVLRRVERGPALTGEPDLPYSSRAKKVLELSMAAARDLGHGYVGQEHILLGLIREGESIAAHSLAALGVDLEGAISEIRRLLGEDVAAISRAAPSARISGAQRARRDARERSGARREDLRLIDSIEANRRAPLAGDNPFRLQIELHRLDPPAGVGIARKAMLRQLLNLRYRETRGASRENRQEGRLDGDVHPRVDDRDPPGMVGVLHLDLVRMAHGIMITPDQDCEIDPSLVVPMIP